MYAKNSGCQNTLFLSSPHPEPQPDGCRPSWVLHSLLKSIKLHFPPIKGKVLSCCVAVKVSEKLRFSPHSLFNIQCKKACLTSLRQYLKGIKEKKSKSPPTLRFGQVGWMSCSIVWPCNPREKNTALFFPLLVPANWCLSKTMGRKRRQWYHFMASQISLRAVGQGLLHSTAECLIDFHKVPSDLQTCQILVAKLLA